LRKGTSEGDCWRIGTTVAC